MADTDRQIPFSSVSWTKDGDILAFINQARRDREDNQFSIDRQFEFNREWYLGHQNLLPDDAGNFILPENDQGRVRLVDNRILPHVETLSSWLGFEAVRLEAIAGSDSVDEHDKSRLRTQVLEYYRELLDLEDVVDENDQYGLLAGNAYLKTTWDPDAGPEMEMDADFVANTAARVELGEGRTERLLSRKRRDGAIGVPAGDLKVENVPMTCITWGPRGSKFKEAEWVLETRERSANYVRERYGLKPEELPQSDREYLAWRPDDMTSYGIGKKQRASQDAVLVHELWAAKNTATSPNGRHIIAIEDKVISRRDNPYQHGKIPYVEWQYYPVAGRVFGMSPVENLLSLQADLNRNISQQTEIREKFANPQVYAEPGAILDESEWTNAAGVIRHVTSKDAIRTEEGHSAPGTSLYQVDRTTKAMQDVVGAHDVSEAKAPSNVKSGVAIRALQEKDEARMGRIVRRKHRAWEGVGHLMLSTLQQFLEDEERIGAIVGEDNRTEVIRFSGNILAGEHYRVKVRTTGLPRSRGAQMELVNMLLQTQLFNEQIYTPPVQHRIIEMLQLGDTRLNIDPSRQSRNWAKYENDQVANGESPEAGVQDMHEAHIEEHRKFQRSGKYRGMDQDVDQRMEQHILGHEIKQAEQSFHAYMVSQQVAKSMGIGQQSRAGNGQPQQVGQSRQTNRF